MRKIFFFVVAITIISCQPEVKVDYVIVSGKILNSDSKKLTVYSQFDRDNKIEITLKEDGSFKDTLKMSSDFYLLRQNRNSMEIFAPKGSFINIEYDSQKKDSTIQFSGSESIINNYILDKKEVSKSVKGGLKEMYLKDENGFKEHILKIKSTQEDLLTKTDGISDEYKNNELKNIYYEYLSYLNRYQTYHRHFSKNKEFKVSENLLDELENIELENENDFTFSQYYRNIVSSKLRNTAKKLIEKDSIANDIAYLKIAAELKTDIIRNKLLFDAAKYGITYTENLEDYYTIFSKNSTNDDNNVKIAKDYKKLKALSKGSPSPKFANYENNAGGKTSLDDLNGKYTYIDVWATWCGPCIREIPSLKKIEKEFHSENIEFVSISIDREKDHKKWKKMIVDRSLGGIQLFADKNWESKFIQDYMIKGIPRFILIDPQGNIVNSNAPRPSDKKLVETLKSLDL